MKTKIIAVVGPTAVGKTALGIELAQRYNGEIISGDSQQVYRQLDIGTAKATKEEQGLAPHHLIDVRDVTEGYSAYDFVAEASQLIAELAEKGKVPIIVGGTGLYIQSLLEGYHLGGQVAHEEILAYRKELDTWPDERLFGKIAELGIEIPQINRRRAMRQLELAHFGQELENQEPPYEALVIGLSDERAVLYERINQRVNQMVEVGLLEEAKWLYETYPTAQASLGIGYKEWFPYFKGEITVTEAIDKVKQNTRRFAKRQLTWFRNRMQVVFDLVSEEGFKDQIFQRVTEFLEEKS
ncbi:tRNA (adenosine(37)-N6)-dimethylallyltransferase MiaA [Streptococcus sp. zg-86]|uniref:tRNA dimethylallyltransferase n=1 Tax=Streptococcus zhangguiae TaxID=2664091 RepID=A0A6I4RU05_9STRE|nr:MULTISPECIES: tRNA (adenosine(37)-N6)-dimethylallyltransferase MiaA [unclassified Streptococcus]MTB64565.1 tRNA (adenosine(37)-N6)-dimethylallyltransferase MiaA [Streptococcus sp. zg-86]MTB90745.1 tRNA (adenosine(37)-N6)-dimethylallyltransferase MiaA [Streptococcus sp. zg-36]MWV56552.1 tRNA (adenosine(37)-N6)-dimethylallyltransferase MiaA [Streptococcus sp. zg-70]QTH47243.1 tRNA (adenosine(37)-N6)-dimethylallyltransferase MiaA [Streptococcus sp. zg-86]